MQGFYFLAVIALIVVPSLADKTSWPGKKCVVENGLTDCETVTTGLICTNNQCACDKSKYPEMEFYIPTGKCVLPVGAPCTAAPPAQDRITPNAICTANDNVTCTPWYTTSGKRCLKTSGPCTADIDCNQDAFETCEGLVFPLNAKCGCSAGSQKINGICQLNADQDCPAAGTYPGKSCHAEALCTGIPSKCRCKRGMEKTDEGNCRAPYQEFCSSPTYPCNEVAFVECINNICACRQKGNDIWYDTYLKKCAIRAESKCIPWENQQPCVSNAKCEGNDPNNGVCKCQDQFDVNADWLCKLRYGAPCTVATNFCDTKANQKCIAVGTEANGKCACIEPAKMNLEGKECKYKVGEKCNPTSGPSCVLHSQCKKVGDKTTTTCACDEPFFKNSKGNCVRKHGSFCTSNYDCDTDNFLACSAEGKCSCADPTTMEFDKTTEKCYLKLNAACTVGEQECQVDSLECILGKCSCSPKLGFIADGTDACLKPFNATCKVDDAIKCSRFDYLECLDGLCNCDANHIHRSDSKDKLCLGLFNATCAENTDCDEEALLFCNKDSLKCACPFGLEFGPKSTKCGAAQFALHLGIALLGFVSFLFRA